MNPSRSTMARTTRSQGRPRGHHTSVCPVESGAAVAPSGSVPDGLPATVTTGATYSIGSPETPDAALVMSRLQGTVVSYGDPSGAKNAPYARPTTRAVTRTVNRPAP